MSSFSERPQTVIVDVGACSTKIGLADPGVGKWISSYCGVIHQLISKPINCLTRINPTVMSKQVILIIVLVLMYLLLIVLCGRYCTWIP